MVWNPIDQSIVVGPVSVTSPTLPIGLRLEFDGVVLSRVRATTPRGESYSFTAAPHDYR